MLLSHRSFHLHGPILEIDLPADWCEFLRPDGAWLSTHSLQKCLENVLWRTKDTLYIAISISVSIAVIWKIIGRKRYAYVSQMCAV